MLKLYFKACEWDQDILLQILKQRQTKTDNQDGGTIVEKKKIFALAVVTVTIGENVNVNTGTIFWVRRTLQERKIYDRYNKLTNELCLFDKEYFFCFLRMTLKLFKHLLSLVGPHLQRTTTRVKEKISAAERLVLTLRFLASGGSQQSLCFSFRISRAAICTILRKTCESLW